jgi:hypothetical protein
MAWAKVTEDNKHIPSKNFTTLLEAIALKFHLN